MKQLLVIAFIFFTAHCFSQAIPKYGFKIGANFADLTFEGKDVADTRNGFATGFFINYSINDKFKVQPELQYSAQGSKQFRVEYLQLPIMAKYVVTKNFNLQLGPQVGLKIHEFQDGLKNLDYAAVGGIGINIIENVEFDIRYAFGLQQIFDDPNVFQDSQHRYVQVTIAYTL
ncbi:porin family protein [Spongiivirga sp. MCCC 1A20706]|uniref:porin family protein n=1 Tax=Spongiivirga sp. MCCC 1A20706 TaxID=3160963 RepID=UPI003977420C